ncbi:hydroxymethylpyrimidine/phosphomethylpyrimidine kinase [Flavobacterium sp. FPG59]|jgi:hydroxymethylpyrimidine/phosphomethylpyrimidine kinase|uniref:hydroxymethylpyrimidine/phosphomethylpyrimidine kinase n=1 Tax=Flavobacterium sp. FPG59 TaxID=1929267 RepID=UPI000A36A907|nr:hydroxymethylpyrimidine/phosphomethylpyrimidine kinase [Flavobacterium sp. FPG59]OUD36549.1 hydroxymethylpyrimidine/phosphomethylpyrimidine kinase [Flavobacterium sp. FPG59]
MSRPFVVSIAGFDPSAGAGVLADVKTFEQHQVYGFAISTANTIQTENEFVAIQWTDLDFVLQSVQTIFNTYDIKAVKIGIVPSLAFLKAVVCLIKKLSPQTKIVWDTVLKSTTNFDFLIIENQNDLVDVLNELELITPNYDEILKLDLKENSIDIITEYISKNCAVLLKGGHHPTEIGTDYLHTSNQFFKLESKNAKIHPKHGSGCVLSAAITANLALGQELLTACKNAKSYTENFLMSNPTQLGYHYVP